MSRMRPIVAAGMAAVPPSLASAPASARALHGDVDAPLPLAAYLVGAGRALGLVRIGYTLVVLRGMAWYGRDRGRSHGEVFSVRFGSIGRLAPYGLEGSPRHGAVRRRGFGSALPRTRWSDSLVVVVLGTGSVIWDGLSPFVAG